MNFAAVDLNLLRVFDAMMAELSTVRAGERLGLSQPAVSSALARLRHVAGDQLFVREGNRMVATPRALQLASPVREALAQLEMALAAMRPFDTATASDEFMILGSDYFSSLLMPRLAAGAMRRAPGITIQMVSVPATDVFRQLGEGRAVAAVDRSMEPPEWIGKRVLFQSWLVCIAHRDNPTLARAGIRPGDAIPPHVFCSLPHVMLSMDGGRTGTIDPMLARNGLSRRVAITVPHFHGVALTAATTDLLGSLPVHFARQVATSLPIDVYATPFTSPAMDVSLYWHRRTERDPAAAWLREEIVAALDFDETSSG